LEIGSLGASPDNRIEMIENAAVLEELSAPFGGSPVFCHVMKFKTFASELTSQVK
jgi:hypothetical protein